MAEISKEGATRNLEDVVAKFGTHKGFSKQLMEVFKDARYKIPNCKNEQNRPTTVFLLASGFFTKLANKKFETACLHFARSVGEVTDNEVDWGSPALNLCHLIIRYLHYTVLGNAGSEYGLGEENVVWDLYKEELSKNIVHLDQVDRTLDISGPDVVDYLQMIVEACVPEESWALPPFLSPREPSLSPPPVKRMRSDNYSSVNYSQEDSSFNRTRKRRDTFEMKWADCKSAVETGRAFDYVSGSYLQLMTKLCYQMRWKMPKDTTVKFQGVEEGFDLTTWASIMMRISEESKGDPTDFLARIGGYGMLEKFSFIPGCVQKFATCMHVYDEKYGRGKIEGLYKMSTMSRGIDSSCSAEDLDRDLEKAQRAQPTTRAPKSYNYLD